MQPPFTVWSVGEIAQHLRTVVESDEVLGDVWLRGEVSNLARPPSGHLYFTLKDSAAAVRCVMWRRDAARLAQPPREGQAVFAHGRFTVYEVRGDLQMLCDQVQALGAGLLYQQFEAVKRRLEEEGLFAAERKRPVPSSPRAIGIVTSREGAVLHDILHIVRRRYPLVRLYLAPTLVQGERAPDQICAALSLAQQVEEVEVVILARGGGSLEDLWAFNDERVARAIVACRVPVVTGVGHETDFTIADFCADLRAPTPTAAAQFCTPDQNELRARLLVFRRQLGQRARDVLGEGRVRLGQDRRALRRNSPLAQVDHSRQQVDDLTRSAVAIFRRQIALRRAELEGRLRQMRALDPAATLGRGYALVQRKSDDAPVTQVAQVPPGTDLSVRVQDGTFQAQVMQES